jgi:glycosyltransferase involved in cell wall biosynthesis
VKSKLVFLDVDHNKISVIPPFLPPIVKQKEIDMIPQETWDFIDSHRPVISANASQIAFHNDQDLYGIDMCVDLCSKLRLAYPEVNPDYFNRIRQRISENGITDNFLFVTDPCQFYPILMRSDLFVRPTNTDGDAVSLREALYFRIPAVASDIVPRPKGVVTFSDRNFEDFALKVQSLLDNYGLTKKKAEVVETEQSFRKILSLYEHLND